MIPIHVPREQNSWFYLRTEEERRCCGELQNDLPAIYTNFRRQGHFSRRLKLIARGIEPRFATCLGAAIRNHSRQDEKRGVSAVSTNQIAARHARLGPESRFLSTGGQELHVRMPIMPMLKFGHDRIKNHRY